MPGIRRHVVIEQVGWRLGIDGAIVQHDQAILALEDEAPRFLGERRRDEAGRVVSVEGDVRADGGRHGREARALQEGLPTEHERVGPVWVLRVEFAQAALFPAIV